MRTWLALVGLALACASKSPFTRSPAAVGVSEPCRFMGTVHKESRQRLEALRACKAIALDEWSCMTSALQQIDREFTAVCRARSVAYEEIAARQREEYARCASAPSAETLECALLSQDPECLDRVCR